MILSDFGYKWLRVFSYALLAVQAVTPSIPAAPLKQVTRDRAANRRGVAILVRNRPCNPTVTQHVREQPTMLRNIGCQKLSFGLVISTCPIVSAVLG